MSNFQVSQDQFLFRFRAKITLFDIIKPLHYKAIYFGFVDWLAATGQFGNANAALATSAGRQTAQRVERMLLDGYLVDVWVTS